MTQIFEKSVRRRLHVHVVVLSHRHCPSRNLSTTISDDEVEIHTVKEFFKKIIALVNYIEKFSWFCQLLFLEVSIICLTS